MLQPMDFRGRGGEDSLHQAQQALENLGEGSLLTIVDDDSVKDQLVALARSLDFTVEVEQKDQEFYIRMTKGDLSSYATALDSRGPWVLVLTSNSLGRGDEQLGRLLMRNFLYTLAQGEDTPGAVLLMNGGVFLAAEGSEAIEFLWELERKGSEVLACGTCLDHYGLKEKLAAGKVSNMYTITEQMMQAYKVVQF